MAKTLEDEENLDVIKLYISLALDFHLTVNFEDVRYYHDKLQDKGYQQIQGYFLYYCHAEYQMEKIVEEALVYDLEEPDRVAALFSADELAEI